jgi:hypothetical protein
MRNDVQLRSTDDRLCQICFDKNEADLALLRKNATDAKATSTGAARRESLKSPAVTTKRASSSLVLSSTANTAATEVTAISGADDNRANPANEAAEVLKSTITPPSNRLLVLAM